MQRHVQIVPIRLDSSTAIKMITAQGSSMFRERELMVRSSLWHMIKIIKGSHYDREEVLNAILAAVEPTELIPVRYQVSGEHSFFIVRDCVPALEKLCKSSLIIKNGNKDPIILDITLGYASIHDLKFNIQLILLPALDKRYDLAKKTLDLTNFHNDPDIIQHVYCPLKQHQTFSQVLKLCANSVGHPETLILQRNELTSLDAFEGADIISVRNLDLRYNDILNISALKILKPLYITKLWLDGNPLCENYSSTSCYIESVKKYCPYLEQLDGVILNSMGLPHTYNKYLKNEKREALLKKFAKHFFFLLDLTDRTNLHELYTRNSVYSLSFGLNHMLAHVSGVGQYTASRNLLRSSDSKKHLNHIYCGQDNILTGLKKLPKSYHDPKTFMYDLQYDDGKCLMFNVSGVFKKTENSNVILYFNRSFILQADLDNEYHILNDQYHIDGKPDRIKFGSVVVKYSYDEFEPRCFSEPERKELKLKFMEVTTLNDEWCVSYLDDNKWNIRKAITMFMKDYEASNIPSHAFLR